MTKPDGIDQSWGFADPHAAAAAGIKVVSMYLSRDRSKNVTAAKVKAYHAVGIGVILNWEGQAGAPLLGAGQGAADATDAISQVGALIKGVGYAPKSQIGVIFSCDRDTKPSDYPKIDAYYGATKAKTHAAELLNGNYGEADLCAHLAAKGLTDVQWQTYAWSGGRLDPVADFYQFHNGQTLGGASVDFDKIIHPSQIGAWWPPNHPLNIGEDVALTDAEIQAVAKAVWGYQISNSADPKVPHTAPASAFLTHDNNLANADHAVLAAVQAGLAKLSVSGVDADALAKAVVEHLAITAK